MYCALFFFVTSKFRQNSAPSGLKKRGLDASINHKTRKPTEELRACPFRGLRTDALRFARSQRRTERNDPNRVFNEQFKGNIERTTDKTQ
ncbi:hypothetical protein D1609_06145 [Leptospira borgpetersenii serovar Hardjo-bovis]|nr:hypothetical protein D1609_06145 [Leptospira borgpetersenii serovar Hardjo-bovis]